MTTEFALLNLHPNLVQTLTGLDHLQPTPIQAAVIPALLEGADVIGQAQTGTGKTAAFALPILHNLTPDRGHVQVLVLAPTRELAKQVSAAMSRYGVSTKVRTLAVYGGQPYSPQIRALKMGVDVVVGTPGRLLDLIDRGVLNLEAVSTVVLDEADEMLSMGFIADIESILEKTPQERQTALFSATMPPAIRRIASRHMRNPQPFTMDQKQLTVDSVDQRFYVINESDKPAALVRLLEMEESTSVLIFARTRQATGELADGLSRHGFPAEALSGDLSQEARERVLARFRHQRIKVLVATDVAARGLDIDDISHVVNFDLPQDPEVYVHRVGRTGRAGRSGIALSLVTPRERWLLQRIEKFAGQRLTRAQLPTIEDILDLRDARLLEQAEVWLKRGRCSREREIVRLLAEAGHDQMEIATAAMKLARGGDNQGPISSINEIKDWGPRPEGRFDRGNGNRRGKWSAKRPQRGGGRRPDGRSTDQGGRDRETGMVRLSLSRGSADGLMVSHVVGAISHQADIPGSVLGRITIHDSHSFVDVPEQFVDQVLAKAGTFRMGRRTMDIRRV